MRKINKTIIWTMLLCIVLGAVIVLAGQWTLHKTSSTEFCLSCHTMQAPYEEYTGSVHFQNQKGIRAECADCHIPEGGLDYLVAKLRASKDVYHQFITKKSIPRKNLKNIVWRWRKPSGHSSRRVILRPAVAATVWTPWILLHKARMPRRCTKWASRKSKPVLIAIKASPISHLK